MASRELNLNERGLRVAEELIARQDELGVSAQEIAGARVIDAGVTQAGSIAAGVLMARACLADLAGVTVTPVQVGSGAGVTLPGVAVSVTQPIAACMASQYAGWQINTDGYFAMGSGPMRAAAAGVAGPGEGEKLYDTIGFRQRADAAIGVLEAAKLPTPEVIAYLARKCGVAPQRLTLIVARTASLAGGVQIVARSVETALHKLHELKFDLHRVVEGYGIAPLPPVAKNDVKAIGRTNDAVLYGAQVTLVVRGDDESLAAVGAQLPSSASRDYGRPFAEVFKQYHHDFYKIDPMLFSPAAVCLQNLDTGRSHRVGAVNPAVLEASFFGG